MKPLVSIITPSLNCGAYIEETLRSVVQQDYPHIEHIVLDSGSTDETLAILARYPSVRLVTDAPQGKTEKVNHGFSIARGEIIAWLNADDFFLPGAVSRAVDAIERNPGVAVVYGNLLQVDEHSVELDERERTRQANWHDMLARQYVPLCSAFVRREALERVGPLDTRYPLVQDWDLWLRISKQYAMLYVDDWWGAFRVREGQHSDLYKYDLWVQSRRMTKEHGARFLPLFLDYWGTKLRNARRMILNGEFDRLNSKLLSYALSVARHLSIRNRSDY